MKNHLVESSLINAILRLKKRHFKGILLSPWLGNSINLFCFLTADYGEVKTQRAGCTARMYYYTTVERCFDRKSDFRRIDLEMGLSLCFFPSDVTCRTTVCWHDRLPESQQSDTDLHTGCTSSGLPPERLSSAPRTWEVAISRVAS